MTRSGTVYTVGHGTLGEAELVVLLGEAGVEHVVDVRSYPTSRHNPQHSQDQLERSLPTGGIAYSWDQRLGGRRRPNPASPNVALRNDAFRAYADHMGTPGFHDGLDALVELAATRAVAVMCAESVWWRCHRRLLADAVVMLRLVPVAHLFHDGHLAAHEPTPEARVAEGQLVYDLGATAPLL
ncbi:MAG TPA: DUF488 domain-containing protein [Acidimicrobiales bacterium]|nr:DUF488 domain-containing protein [Acidimicrobiales bacterium]